MLVVSDSFYPGWRALVDGVPRPVLRVDHALQGVLVPAGATTVELVYEPASVKIGLLLSLFGVYLWVAGAVVTLTRRDHASDFQISPAAPPSR